MNPLALEQSRPCWAGSDGSRGWPLRDLSSEPRVNG